ncbi:ABC transporter substrate-binding protein [bacterium]|nr:MAG: ABC transporter substrate-binding protein [bacterium]
MFGRRKQVAWTDKENPALVLIGNHFTVSGNARKRLCEAAPTCAGRCHLADHSISRESFLKGATIGAAALSAGFPAFIPSRGEAADVLKIGQIAELTGVYVDISQPEVFGAALALERWNKKGGVMGRKVEVVVEDDQNDPGVAVQKVRKLVNQDKVSAVFGTVNSAIALSASGAANSLGALYMVTGGHTDPVTSTQCHWDVFRTCHTAWQETQATGLSIAKKFGKKWYLVTPDYAFGHSLASGYEAVIKKLGGQIVANDLTPLGTSDFSTYITKIGPAKPDVIIVLLAGADFVNFLKQANSYGLLKKFPVAGPQAELEPFLSLPPESRVGYWGVEWYYNSDLVYGKKNVQAANFVKEYRAKHGTPPSARSAFGYVTLDRMLWAMNEAKTTDPVKVARKLENAHFETIWDGGAYYRGTDHQLMWPNYFVEMRPNGTPADKNDIFNVIDRQPADKISKSVAEQSQVCNLKYPS